MPKKVDTSLQRKAQIRDALRDTGLLIAEARKERGWSQSDLGQRLGDVDRRHVSALEKGDPKVGFGLVVAALWLLDLPLLATLPEQDLSAATITAFLANIGVPRSRRARGKRLKKSEKIHNNF